MNRLSLLVFAWVLAVGCQDEGAGTPPADPSDLGPVDVEQDVSSPDAGSSVPDHIWL